MKIYVEIFILLLRLTTSENHGGGCGGGVISLKNSQNVKEEDEHGLVKPSRTDAGRSSDPADYPHAFPVLESPPLLSMRRSKGSNTRTLSTMAHLLKQTKQTNALEGARTF